MTRSPLVAALLSGSFVLQLLLAGGGALCVDERHGGTHATGAATVAMPGMDMAMEMPSMSGPSPSSDHPASNDEPCDEPQTAAECLVIAPCSASFVGIAVSALDAGLPSPLRVGAGSALEPTSRTIPPELPPPRA